MLPTNRESFKQFVLQELGKTVLDINVSDEQVENQIDLALQYYADYHFDGTSKHYYKLPITGDLRSDAIKEVKVINGGTGYSNTDTLTFSSPPIGETVPNGSITTDNTGTILTIDLTDFGKNYAYAPTVTINSSFGSGAILSADMGGYTILPDNIIGISRVFPFHFFTAGSDMFSVEYQFALNNMYNIVNSQLVPFYMSKMHLQLFQEILVGRPSFRFNRKTNRLYIDVLNDRLKEGEYMVIETFMVIDPMEFAEIWTDRFLIRYTVALVKKQYGQNLTKFIGGMMPGGIAFNGERILDDALNEIAKLEAEMLNSWSMPVIDTIA